MRRWLWRYRRLILVTPVVAIGLVVLLNVAFGPGNALAYVPMPVAFVVFMVFASRYDKDKADLIGRASACGWRACTDCGYPLGEDAEGCSECGMRITAAEAVASWTGSGGGREGVRRGRGSAGSNKPS